MNVPAPIVHILKFGRSYCEMPGVPGTWPDNHLFISFQDEENAKEANCPECVARRDAGPHLAERLNGDNHEQVGVKYAIMPLPDGAGGIRWSGGKLPDGVRLDESSFDAFEEATGQSAHFDQDLGRWHKVG
jgi:hypothetical protein